MFRSLRVLIGVTVALVGLALTTATRVAAAPAAGPTPKRTVTVVLLDDFSSPGIAAIVRRERATAEPLIFVKQGALTPKLLAAAIRLVPDTDRKQASTGRLDIVIREKTTLTPVAAADVGRMTGWVSELRGAPLAQIPRIGMRRMIRITIG